MVLAEYVLLVANTLLLLLEGASDRRFRGVPYQLVVVHVVLAVGALTLRYGLLDKQVFVAVYATTGVLLVVLAAVYLLTGFIGEGDVIVVSSSSAVTPYVPLGRLSGIPLVAPLTIALSSTYLLYGYHRTTKTVYLKGLGKVRVRARYTIDFKKGSFRDEVPVYIEGYGAVPSRVRRNPKYLEELLSRVPDHVVVYTVPNYPYVYYYSFAFLATYPLLLLVSILADLVVF